VPGEERESVIVADEVAVGDDVYFDVQDPDKNIPVGIPIPAPSDFYCGDSSNSSKQSVEYSEAEEKPVISTDDPKCGSKITDDDLFFDIPEEYDLHECGVKNEFVSEFNDNVNPVDNFSYLLDDSYLGAAFDLGTAFDNQYSEGLYLETNDLLNSVEVDQTGFDFSEYLTFFDADGETPESMNSQLISGESSVPEQASAIEKPVEDEGEKISMASEHVPDVRGENDASSSNQNLEPETKPEPAKFESDVKYPFLKQASHLLGNIPAQPAFASEFPSKNAILKLNSEGQSSSSVHVTADVIRIRNMTLNASGMEWSYGKDGNLNVVFSFNLSQDVVPPTMSPKARVVISRSWYLLMFFWVLILSASFKIASSIYTR
jgi:hypothetical protein